MKRVVRKTSTTMVADSFAAPLIGGASNANPKFGTKKLKRVLWSAYSRAADATLVAVRTGV